jgi:hypothetical protein
MIFPTLDLSNEEKVARRTLKIERQTDFYYKNQTRPKESI